MKKVLITGASSGLGLELGKLLQQQKIEVINLSRHKSPFENISLDLENDETITKTIALLFIYIIIY